jgi:high-affinity nickel-transport protein
MSVGVSTASLLVAAFGIGKMLSPDIDRWSDGKELMFGLAVVLLVTTSYLFARRIKRQYLPVREPA